MPGLPRWAFHGSEEFPARAESIPSDLDILISTARCMAMADFCRPAVRLLNVGDRALAGALGSLNPGLLICGHIHEQNGLHDENGVHIANRQPRGRELRTWQKADGLHRSPAVPEYDEWDRIQPNPSYESRPGVDHTRAARR